MNEQRFIDIEMKLAYQERLLADLDQVVVGQQAQLERLEQVCRTLGERVAALAETPIAVPADDRPPHY